MPDTKLYAIVQNGDDDMIYCRDLAFRRRSFFGGKPDWLLSAAEAADLYELAKTNGDKVKVKKVQIHIMEEPSAGEFRAMQREALIKRKGLKPEEVKIIKQS